MVVALILVLVAVGSVLFHMLARGGGRRSPRTGAISTTRSPSRSGLLESVFFAVIVFMAYCVYRFRHQEGRRARYQPENKTLEWWLTIGTAVGVAAMLAPGLFVWHQFVTVPRRRDRGRSRGPAMAVELSPAWQGRPARHVRYAQCQRRQSTGPQSHDPHGQDDIVIVERRSAPAGRQAGQGAAPRHRRRARFLRAGIPGKDGYDPGHRHLFLVHPDQDRRV